MTILRSCPLPPPTPSWMRHAPPDPSGAADPAMRHVPAGYPAHHTYPLLFLKASCAVVLQLLRDGKDVRANALPLVLEEVRCLCLSLLVFVVPPPHTDLFGSDSLRVGVFVLRGCVPRKRCWRGP
jgi:hypothetical protein